MKPNRTVKENSVISELKHDNIKVHLRIRRKKRDFQYVDAGERCEARLKRSNHRVGHFVSHADYICTRQGSCDF